MACYRDRLASIQEALVALAKPRRTYLSVQYVTNDGTEPAQREFVHRLIDWNRIRSRHERYPAIRQAFPLETMMKGDMRGAMRAKPLSVGPWAGYWSLRVTGNWRIVFRFEEGAVHDVDFVDDHGKRKRR